MNCEFPNCNNHSINGQYCIGHAKMMNDRTVIKPKGLRKRSEKTAELMKTYKPRVKAFLARPENEVCLILSPVCTVKATAVNHKKRRGINLLEEKYWEPCCPRCNNWIEQHPDWAIQNGHLISVHQVDKTSA